MGQTLSSPAVSKKTEEGGNSKFAYAVSEMQGWRISMEDAHAVALNLDNESDDCDTNSFFAVYDGHGGATVAKYAGEYVHKRLIEGDDYKSGQYREALKRAFLETDAEMKSNPSFIRDPAGCTAVAALVDRGNKVYVANAGDSRSVISSKGASQPLSIDHKPQNEIEKARIVAAGGFIEFGRVNGNLALARALGDFDYKKNNNLPAEEQIITSNPEIIEHQITEEDEFIVIACDGIWDCLSSQQVIDCIRLLVSQGNKLPEVCEIICDHCLAPDTTSGAGIGCDNMTIMIIALLHGRTTDQWYHWVADCVDKGIGRKVPPELPTLYSMTRIMNFRKRQVAQEERNQRFRDAYPQDAPQMSPFARILGSGGIGNIAFVPSSSNFGEGGLMFDEIDSEEEDDPITEVANNMLQHQLEQLKRQADEAREQEREQGAHITDADDEDDEDPDLPARVFGMTTPPPPSDGAAKGTGNARELQGEAPPPPHPIPNGNAKPEQLHSEPGGDAPSPAVSAEGFLDASEDPLKV